VGLIKDPRSWTVEDVGVWLQWLGIGEHAEAFAARAVDGLALLQLSAESAWSDLGVVDPAQQRVLDSAVEPLRCFRDQEGQESGLALHAIEGPVAGEVFFVGGGGITGGRHSATNGVVLSENYVSRRHFQITRDRAGQHLLQDVGSTTGTFLMVREDVPLDDKMVLQLGTTELTVYLEGDRCTLVATEGPDKDARAAVPPQGLFVGREGTNGLCIRDPQISAYHCEVRLTDQGFVLDDKYSTNRTWLRLAPDGQPSKRFLLRVGDLFKVGSTLFHIVDPASIASEQAEGGVPLHSGTMGMPLPVSMSSRPPMSDGSGSADGDSGHGHPYSPVPHTGLGTVGRLSQREVSSPGSSDAGDGMPHGMHLRWEPFVEGERRPHLPPEEYAQRVTASRQRMHAEGSARRSARSGSARGGGQDAHGDIRERELDSLQQRMRNSRAQTAIMQQESGGTREDEGPNNKDEDVCKICYDKGIDVVLYPCGHFVLCRWCAQKVSDCPVCRFVITDVIRTYKA